MDVKMEQQLVNKEVPLEEFVSNLSDDALNGDFEEIYKSAPRSKDGMCGLFGYRSRWLQGFANKKAFILVFGVVGLIFSSTHSYYNGTITTIEKRFKIPTRNIGLIATGNDITSLLLSTFIAYYVAQRHRPRWLGISIFVIVIYCFINAMPHFLFGPGEEALSLTEESGAIHDPEHSAMLQEAKDRKMLCRTNATTTESACRKSDEGDFFAQIFFFVAQLVAGVGQSLKHTLGISYLDDNIKKSKAPALVSFSYFIRLLGPALGYNLASFSLNIYVAPDLTPTITNKDPRWIGAWYLGWIFLGFILLFFIPIMAMFPKHLPRAMVRSAIEKEKEKRMKMKTLEIVDSENEKKGISVNGLANTFKRLLTNKIFMLNNLASIFYLFGLQPFWTFTAKIMENLYHISASSANFYVGTFGLTASALGILTAGVIISKFQPTARTLTLWNVFIGVMSALAVLSFAFMGCDQNDNSVKKMNLNAVCNADCHCDFVRFSPVCGNDGQTYISACHAGCQSISKVNATKVFNSCSCIEGNNFESSATAGTCSVNCNMVLVLFITVKCFMKFLGASGRVSNFLVGIRCIEKEDKAVALGFGMGLIRLCATVPSPIFFGYILDSACLVFGKTCSSRGNCWLYDAETLRYSFNFIASGAIFIGALFDLGVWYYSKDLKVFDENDEEKAKEAAAEN